MSIQYYRELDGVRGFAALTIFFFHFFHGQHYEGVWANVWIKGISFGPSMANLFFVLSGFLITQILLKAKGGDRYFSYYYTRRILRIFPLYYLALLIYFFGLPLLYNRPIPGFGLQWYNWFHLQNLPLTFSWPYAGPKYLWSLAVEEHFYLLWPMLVLWLNKRQLLVACFVFFAGSIVARGFLSSAHYPTTTFTLCAIDALAIGAVAGILNYDGYLQDKRKVLKRLLIATGIPAIGLWLVFFGTRNSFFHVMMPTLLNLFYATALSYLVTTPAHHKMKNLFTTPALTFTGTVSYGFFIFHPLCISFTHRMLGNSNMFLQMLVALTASILVATLSYYWFEKQFISLKRYWERKN